ncbi:hypothetical protein TNCV_1442441 [Trichonephila clavipes]|uniref:Uncharacterized protein n=1 Tax=Trichonephila clavipes TaxID=2585209 RepID=A0A8X6RU76_TRICX|nr:hypothetical protein TNCV_1442441 [Trichonephila clavipes]
MTIRTRFCSSLLRDFETRSFDDDYNRVDTLLLRLRPAKLLFTELYIAVIKLFKRLLEFQNSCCERRASFGDNSLESSEPPSSASASFEGSKKHLCLHFPFPRESRPVALLQLRLHPASDEEKGPSRCQKVGGRSKRVLRKNSKLHLCLYMCGDHFHRNAEYSCENEDVTISAKVNSLSPKCKI